MGSLKERRALFDDYCRTSADEHVRRKAQRARAGRECFQALLDEAASPGAHAARSSHAQQMGHALVCLRLHASALGSSV